MLNLTKKAILSVLMAFCARAQLEAQELNGFWHTAPRGIEEILGMPVIRPTKYAVFTTEEVLLKAFLESVPDNYQRAALFVLPLPEGGYRRFRIWATSMMEAPLANKYPFITTYTAEAIGNPQITAKIDYTPAGFHAMVFDGDNTFLVDPYSKNADGTYISFYKRDYSRTHERAFCGTEKGEWGRRANDASAKRRNGTERRQYRLALAADSEYCAAVAGPNPSKADVLAKMATSMNRVNGVYERELSITMVLVAKEDTLIFTGDDPYSNSSGSAMMSENQLTVSTRIGAANYDIGHVFSTAGGGIATRPSVCIDNSKARGVSGWSTPFGDVFDIDLVAHEMGHQFSANHTFNASTGSCASPNGVDSTSFEPGSGSTIMAYAGYCGASNDYQLHSDAYFHSASLEEITNYITIDSEGSRCGSIIPATNMNAVLPPFAADYNIPRLTPFELSGPTAEDNTADTLTYCWEQRNTGGHDFGKTLEQTRTDGPLFRSFPPVSSRTRIFPALDKLVRGLNTPGEKLPDTARIMRFQLTERDIYQGWGAFVIPDDAVTLHVIQTPAAFTVSSFSRHDTVLGGSSQPITWKVAGTADNPISCSAVDIFLSMDGGYTYPFLLKKEAPNNGMATVRLPNPAVSTDSARIKVKGVGNVFFNINASNFRIVHDSAGPTPQVLTIAPIPASNDLRLRIPDSIGSVSVTLVNSLGQTVWQRSIEGDYIIPVRDFARGVYYVRIYGDLLKLTRTIVLR